MASIDKNDKNNINKGNNKNNTYIENNTKIAF